MELLCPSYNTLIAGLLIAIAFSLFVWHKKWLSADGIVAAIVVGGLVWLVGGWKASIPLLVFFISGSLLGKLPRKGIRDAKHGKPRDWKQVVANGGIATFWLAIYFFQHKPLFLHLYLISLSVAAADTWSSEIGLWLGKKVVDIVGFRKMAPGLSGGISLQGTAGGWVGAVVVAVSGFPLLAGNEKAVAISIVLGFAGMLLDSFIGSIFQARYRLPNGIQTEDPQTSRWMSPEKGWKWMTNDLVNLISNLLTAAIAYVLLA